MKILNPATEEMSLFVANYDKLLHILGSFVALLWINRFWLDMPWFQQLGPLCWGKPIAPMLFVFDLCLIKTIWNFVKYGVQNPIGDWLANCVGFCLWFVW